MTDNTDNGRLVHHEPVWRPEPLQINAAGDTRPGFICTHELENGMGECGSNVFRIEDGMSPHSCWVPEVHLFG